MKVTHFILFVLLISQVACSQAPAVRPAINNPKFDQRLTRLLSFTVPTMGVKELERKQKEVVIFDARELEEYQISHIPGAHHLGSKTLNLELLSGFPKDTTLVLYCSVGYRSEKTGERLKEMGFQKVYNLYGSLFEWANQRLPMEDGNGQKTSKIHTYNRKWSQWVEDGKAEKVW